MKKFIKENYKFILVLILIVIVFYAKLPYFILAPGGTINITDRVEMEDYYNKNGSINMLYVSEYKATPVMYLYAKVMNYDIEKNSDRQISNESIKDIKKRETLMRDNSLDIAIIAAYTEAGKKIEIKSKKNIVIGTTNDNGFEVGDIVLLVEKKECDSVKEIREIINTKNEGDIVHFKVLRDNKEIEIDSKVYIEDNTKVVGIVVMTDYEYDLDPKINIKFNKKESGSSGGGMLALTIYNAITKEDIIKGRKISGTGTISADGTIGEIDGVKYKVMGAYKNKMDIVFVPSSNYEEAIDTKNKYNYDIDIVKVDNLKEVINYLKSK